MKCTYQHITLIVSDGALTLFWYDCWFSGQASIHLWHVVSNFSSHPMGTIRELFPVFLLILSLCDPYLVNVNSRLMCALDNSNSKSWKLRAKKGFLIKSFYNSSMIGRCYLVTLLIWKGVCPEKLISSLACLG